jgi:hypothetical protein
MPNKLSLFARTDSLPQSGPALGPAEPLWKIVPQCDERGRSLSDFMMVIPGLRTRPTHVISKTIGDIHDILRLYRHVVVFADLNLKLNVLWVSVRPVPGICLELPAAIHARVPDAKLVAPDFGAF